MMGIPVLETERLVLREHRSADLAAYAAMWAEPEVVLFTSGKPLTQEQAWKKLVGHRGMWAMFGFGYLAIEDKADGRLIGDAGVQDARRRIEPSLAGTLEAGWTLSAAAQGRGFAREAMQAVLSWCDRAHPGTPITCIIDGNHTRSIRLAGHLGFREQARTVYKDRPTIVFRRG